MARVYFLNTIHHTPQAEESTLQQDMVRRLWYDSPAPGGAMIRPEFHKLLMDQRGAAVILWSFFVICIPVYIFISSKFFGGSDGSDSAFVHTVRVFVWLLTIVDLGYYAHWKRQNLSPGVILASAKSTKLFRALADFQGDVEERAALAVSAYVTRKVVVYAIIEAIAVYGFVLAFIGGFVGDQYLLSGLSLVLLIIEFPSERSLGAIVKAAEQARGKNAA